MSPTRRHFLQTSALTAASLAVAQNAHAGGNDLLKVGLIGCGSRGTGAASQALRADRNVKLWAMADAFSDRLESSLQTLQRDQPIQNKIDVPAARRFVGFEAYRNVIEACDVVLLCTPPGFRPIHLAAAVQANKHIFAEKPCAVDAPGIRSVLATCQEARRRNLAVVSGLCLRYDNGFKDTVRRIHDGAIGNVVALQANDYRGGCWLRRREEGMTDMQYQMRNWYYFTWLSGDFNVEQHVHFLDVCAWVLRDQLPVRCYGLGGRQARTGPEYGQIYDHFSVVYEYPNGVRVYSNCRQQAGLPGTGNISGYAMGSNGTAVLSESRRGLILRTPQGERVYDGPSNDMYQTEHDELFASIRSGRPINNGEYMAHSSLVAIMGRMACYTGQTITWEQALNSRQNLSPSAYTWEGQPTSSAIAVPGQTRFE